MTTITCPNCSTLIQIDGLVMQAIKCEQCGADHVQLYTYTANGKEMTLCLACLQAGVWHRSITAVGPSEFKDGGKHGT
jgi:hypothetical protein